MHYLDAQTEALWAVNAARQMRGDAPITLDGGDDDIAAILDAMANLLHLAAAVGEDPQDMADRAVRTFEGDDEDASLITAVPGEIAFHGSPARLVPGTVLTPGVSMHHVFACEDVDAARSWGKKKAGGGEHHVYQVQMGHDAFLSSGHVLATEAVVLEEVTL
jgi:hypothetical protein